MNNKRPLSDNINTIIIHASSLIESGNYIEAFNIINNALVTYANNYELIYMRGICCYNLNDYAAAYYLFRLAIFIANTNKEADDVIIIQESLNTLCSDKNSSSLTPYVLNNALFNIISDRIHNKEFIITYAFLDSCLYDTNKTSARIAMSDNTMYLYIMLEIYICEYTSEHFYDKHIFERYNYSLDNFKNTHTRLRFLLRRICFGFDIIHQYELNAIIQQQHITAEEIITTTKYCIDKNCWCYTMLNTYNIMKDKYPAVADIIYASCQHSISSSSGNKTMCMNTSNYNNNAAITYLNYNDIHDISTHNKLDDSRISIIFCTNNEEYCKECCMYIQRLIVPDNYTLNIIAIRNAPSMASGYNCAMNYSNSRYKIYIHQDTFIIDTDILNKLLNIFNSDANIGLIGNSGSTLFPANGEWWGDNNPDNWCFNLYQDNLLQTKYTNSYLNKLSLEQYNNPEKNYPDNVTIAEASAIDGIFTATDNDIRWREEIFDNWHFYDISQTMEFKKMGFHPVFLCSVSPMLLHELSTSKSSVVQYDKYRRIFLKHYNDIL
ncbi:MAG: hypothetical protein EGS63_06525 [Lachnospira sp.]|nr:hypothetical protein [Lachnospira sp.]